MSSQSNRSFLVSIAPITALAAMAVMALAGCGQCAADCIGSLVAKGVVDVSVGNETELDIELCYESQCETTRLTYDGSGDASCEGMFSCELTERADRKADLRLSMPLSVREIDEDAAITVRIARADTAEVLVDAKLAVGDISDSEICGATCEGTSTSWDE